MIQTLINSSVLYNIRIRPFIGYYINRDWLLLQKINKITKQDKNKLKYGKEKKRNHAKNSKRMIPPGLEPGTFSV